MFCSKCGKQNEAGQQFCSACGASLIMNNQNMNQSINNSNVMNPNYVQTNTIPKKGMGIGKILLIIGGVFVGFIVLIIGFIVVISSSQDKLVCKASNGSITIMHDDEKLTGYTANGFTYDFDGQKAYADTIGVEAYLDEFTDWFEDNTDGTCTRD